MPSVRTRQHLSRSLPGLVEREFTKEKKNTKGEEFSEDFNGPLNGKQ